ncbi:MAG TPA: hypothetical protein VFV99_19050 [Kofleriaceae bacterium]|nr:hypothetical protein [Kofleriaceae bacterium]
MSRAVACLVLMAACWRGGETAAEEPEPQRHVRGQGATCDEARLNVLDVLLHAADPELVKRADTLSQLVGERCNYSAWSSELRRCVSGAKQVDDARLCEKLATDKQRKDFEIGLELVYAKESP